MNLIKKIWNDSVWSKVIAALIIAAIPVSIFWQTIIDIIRSVFLFSKTYWSYILNGLFLIILSIIGIIYFNKKGSRKALKWLRRISNIQAEKCLFLIWFPINGTLVGDYSGLHFNIIKDINNSKIIDDLLRNDVINIDRRFLARMTINRNVYEYLENEILNKGLY